MATKQKQTARYNQVDYSQLNGVPYVRVSTKDQRDNSESLDVQIQHCEEIAAYLGVNIAFEPISEDHSGYDIERDGLNTLRQLIRTRQVNCVILNESSRLSREVRHGEELLDEMYENGCQLLIFFPHRRMMNLHPDSPDREFLLQEMIFNRKWGKMIKMQMMWGKDGKAKRGKMIGWGGVRFGYMKVGKRDDIMFVPNPETREIATNILEWYGNNESVTWICNQLRGTPTPGEYKGYFRRQEKGYWTPSHVYEIVVRHEMYAGRYRQEIEGETYVVEVEPLISEETAEKIAKRLAGNKPLGKERKYDYLFHNGRLTCRCGYSVAGTTFVRADKSLRQYYVCVTENTNLRRIRGKCGTPRLPLQVVDEIGREFLTRLLSDPRGLMQTYHEQQQLAAAANEQLFKRIDQIDRTIQSNEGRLASNQDLLEETMASLRNRNVDPNRRRVLERLKERYQGEVQTLQQLILELEDERNQIQAHLESTNMTEQALQRIEHYLDNEAKRVDEFTVYDFETAMETLGIKVRTEYDKGYWWLAFDIAINADAKPKTVALPIMGENETAAMRLERGEKPLDDDGSFQIEPVLYNARPGYVTFRFIIPYVCSQNNGR